jgi:hypothetical protein
MTQFEAIFAALQATGSRYVVVGGVAVNLHGYQRFTKDVDLVVELIPDQTLRVLEALRALGFKPNLPVEVTDFANPVTRDSWVREKGMMVFQLFSETSRVTVDIFAQYPIAFDALYADSTIVSLPGAALRIASIAHLMQMKREAGRPQDMLDVEKLEMIQQLGSEDHRE